MQQQPILIGFHGKAGHGKTTLCQILAEAAEMKQKSTRIINFKDALVDLLKYMGWNGVKDEKGRRLMQVVATEGCRDCIDTNYWVKKWREKVIPMYWDRSADLILVDDVRFNNEASAIHAFPNSKIVLVASCMSGAACMTEEAKAHRSEAGIVQGFINQTVTPQFGHDHLIAAAAEIWNNSLAQLWWGDFELGGEDGYRTKADAEANSTTGVQCAGGTPQQF